MPFRNLVYSFVLLRWKILAEGLPHINHFNDASELPAEVRISKKRKSEVLNTEKMTWVYMDTYDGHLYTMYSLKSAFEELMSVCCWILYLVFPCLSPCLHSAVLNSRSRGCLDLQRNGRASMTRKKPSGSKRQQCQVGIFSVSHLWLTFDITWWSKPQEKNIPD